MEFKKSYEERTTAEKKIITESYHKLLTTGYSLRDMGASEAALIIEGYISPGENIKFLVFDKKFLFIPYKQKERYIDYILRLSEKYLKDKGIL